MPLTNSHLADEKTGVQKGNKVARHSPSVDVSFDAEPEPFRAWSIKDKRGEGCSGPSRGTVSARSTRTQRPLGLLAPTGERDLKFGSQQLLGT